MSQVGFIPNFSRSHTDLYVRMLGGFWANDEGTELTVNGQPMIDAMNWQRQFYEKYGTQEVVEFVSSLDRSLNSHHPVYAGKRLSCQQCHRTPPHTSNRLPDRGFYDGKVAMMMDGEWQVGSDYISRFRPELNYGVAPFPPPADHPERANTAVVQGAVVIIPAGGKDKEEAAKLLAWMMSPEIVAEAVVAHASLPTSRAAAQDPRFLHVPGFEVFMELMAHPNAKHVIMTPIGLELNEALHEVEGEVLHTGSNPVPLLDKVQTELAPRWKKELSYHTRP